MSGKSKEGIDYAGWSVNIFDGDKKIDKLLDAQGWKGFGVYFFLCQSAYKMNGYYLEWCYDDCATTARRMGGFMGADAVEAAVRLCLRVGLFHEGLFDGWSVLTSKGIQRRFWKAVSASGRRAVPLHRELWLLSPEETEGLDKVARFDDLLPANSVLLPANSDLLPANDHKNKIKEIKVIHTHAREDDDDGFSRFWDAYPKQSGDIRGAYMEYLRALDGGATLADLLAALDWQKNQPRWLENQGQYIPSPEKWLRNRGWMQEKPKPAPPPRKKSGPAPPSEPDPEADAAKLAHMKRMYAKMQKGKNR